MVRAQLFEYRMQEGEPTLMTSHKEGAVHPPDKLPDWPWTEEHTLVAIVVYNDGPAAAVRVTVEVSPAIIKGWKIYQMEKVRLVKKGMINDRRAVFSIRDMAANERQRIDILVRGRPERGSVEATPA